MAKPRCAACGHKLVWVTGRGRFFCPKCGLMASEDAFETSEPEPISPKAVAIAVVALLVVAALAAGLYYAFSNDDTTPDTTDDDPADDEPDPSPSQTTSDEYSVVKIANLMYEEIYLARVYFDEILVWGAGPIGWELDEYLRSKTFYEKYANGWTFPVSVAMDYLMYEGDTPNEYMIQDTLYAWSVLTLFIDYDGVTYTMVGA